MAHVRRKFADLVKSEGSVIAGEAVKRIAGLYAVERQARGKAPVERLQIRQADAKPVLDELEVWLVAQLSKISGKSELAKAIRHAITRLKRLRPYLDHGFLEIDNNCAERAMKAIAIGRKNYMFVGSRGGGKSAAIAYTLIETARLNGVDPQAWLTQRLPDWVDAQTRAMTFFGGVSKSIVCDNLKAAVAKPVWFEPSLTATFEAMAAHYDTTILYQRLLIRTHEPNPAIRWTLFSKAG